jgi:Pyruvate/2-oxoacid:ferredoxin oxidoreductase delta subunit
MPQDVCLTFNGAAESLSRHGIARKISKKEARKILDMCVELGLAQIGDNIQEGVNWICNCCGCCCEALLGYKRLGYTSRIHSNFFAGIGQKTCIKCKVCIKKCPVEAIGVKSGKIIIDERKCIGCGVCVRFCPKKSIALEKREKKNFVPYDSFERCILNAIDEGRLQDYIFDNYDLWTNEMMRKLLGAILKLKPAKFLLAQAQIKSRYLRAIAKSMNSPKH